MAEVVVIGGSGFIGTRLCIRLDSSHRNFAIVDRGISSVFPTRSIAAPVESSAFPDAVPPTTAIINLAAEHRDDVRPTRRYWDVNVGGARNVCSAANRRDAQVIVFTSSVAVYGATLGYVGEDATPNPSSAYGETKLSAESVYREWQAEDRSRRTLVIVRPAAVFGEGGGGNVNLLLSRIVSDRFTLVGAGRNVKSLAYVENVAAFLEYSLTFAPGVHVYNYVDKPDMAMDELIAFVRQQAGLDRRLRWRIPYGVALLAAGVADVVGFVAKRRFEISASRVRKFCQSSQFDTAVAAAGFSPPVSLSDGLVTTVRDLMHDGHRGARA